MTLVEIRPGVSFNEPAAKSIKRMERQIWRPINHNRTTVDYAVQEQLYNEWRRGEHPDIPIVLNPKNSVHVYRDWDANSALASDSNDDEAPWYDNGWRIVNRDELWHREYQHWNDKHINDEEEEDMDWERLDMVIRREVGAALDDRLKPINKKLDEIKEGDIQYPGAEYNAFEAVVGVIREDNKPQEN